MVYNLVVNYLNHLKENIIKIKFIMIMMLKHVTHVSKFNQLQNIIKTN